MHGDVIPLNLIFSNGDCKLIDWELARFDFPEWDLASVKKAFRFSGNSREAFFAAYGNHYDENVLWFVSLLHYCNVVLWRICDFYVRKHIQTNKEKFLSNLNNEMNWIRENI